jgi:hypothetical protein
MFFPFFRSERKIEVINGLIVLLYSAFSVGTLTDDQHAHRQTLSFINLGHIIVS